MFQNKLVHSEAVEVVAFIHQTDLVFFCESRWL